jgi:hypothetical protein
MSTLLPGRAAVRDLVASLVQAAVIPFGGTVFRARIWPVQGFQLPAVLVYGWEETKTAHSLSSAESRYGVSCEMAVETQAAADTAEDVEALLEQIAGAVENAILTSPALLGVAGLVERCASVRTRIEFPEAASSEQRVTGGVSIRFALEWSESWDVVEPDAVGGCADCPDGPEIVLSLPIQQPES